MKQFPTPVLQEWMMDFRGGGGGHHIEKEDVIMSDLQKLIPDRQIKFIDKLLRKYYHLSKKDFEDILEKYHPEKLV